MIDAFTIVKLLPGEGRGALRGYRITTRLNGKRREITVLARTGCEALAAVARQLGDAAPKVAA
jgi:hypothetical protein